MTTGLRDAERPTREARGLTPVATARVALRGGDEPGRTDARRLEDIAEVVQAFARLRFDARASIGPDGDIVDAVAAGVNFLGQELEASYAEMERRVADRTAELAETTREFGRQALHDALTGLPNRVLVMERLSHRLATAKRRRSSFALLYLDLDGFKAVNDDLGHAAGDRLLIETAKCISDVLRSGDTAARMGGDEFVVLLDEVHAPEAAQEVAGRLGQAIRAITGIGRRQPTVTASIGVTIGPTRFRTADAMVAAADVAMYDAKRRAGGCSVLYNDALHGREGR